MNKKPIYAVIALVTLLLMFVPLLPVSAWNYTDETTADDENFEKFGPRADTLLIKLYSNAESEWDSLDAAEIDITDWPLTKPYYDKFTTPPEDEYIDTMWVGPEFGMRLLDMNNNPNEYLGNEDDPDYPDYGGAGPYANPVYPNPMSYANLRKAIWHCHNKPVWLPTIIGVGFYADIYTCVPECFGAFHKPMPNPFPYSPTAAIAELEKDEDGNGAPDFPWLDDGDTVREPGEVYWDINGNGAKDPGEDLEIIFDIRSDDVHRMGIGVLLADEMNAIGIAVDRHIQPSAICTVEWFYNKEVHLYTAGWSLGVDPDHIILWNYFFYWHPGFCYNTGAVHDEILDETSWAVMTANTADEALTNCHAFQDRWPIIAGAVPWFSYSSTYAVYRTYTGTEDDYHGNYWDGIVNVPGYGPDSFFTFLNMHPRGYPSGDGDMVARYAFKVAELKSFNPVYAEWVWEWNVLGQIYDTLLTRNPYTLEPMNWMTSYHMVENYHHSVYGTCTKVTFTLRPDVFFSDGKQLTVADIMFTFVELDNILLDRGLPPPWWYDSVSMILSFSVLDAYNFEVLFDTKSIYFLMRPGGMVILPKQIWKPLAESGPVDSMTADPNMIGPGPWRFEEYSAYSHVKMAANKPETTITTSHEGAVPVTSTMGYFRAMPFQAVTALDRPTELAGRYKLEEGLEDGCIGVTVVNEQVNDEMAVQYSADLYVNDEPVGSAANEYVIPPVDEPCNGHSFDLEVCVSTWACGMVTSSGYWHRLTDGPGFYEYKIHKELEAWVIAGTTITAYYSIDGEKFLLFSFTVTVSGYLKFVIQIHVLSRIKIGEHCHKYWFSNCTRFWFTIKEDIAGSTFYDDIGEPCPYKTQLPTPDFKVDIMDVALAARAFGASPGHERWSTISDIDGNYYIDISDIARIARKFGWVCTHA